MQTLNAEIQKVEESLQEERMERVKLEVEIGREKDCNRVRKLADYVHIFNHNNAQITVQIAVSVPSNSTICDLFEGLSCRVSGLNPNQTPLPYRAFLSVLCCRCSFVRLAGSCRS